MHLRDKYKYKMHDSNQVQPPSPHHLWAVPTGQTTLAEHTELNELHGERARHTFVRVYRSVWSFEMLPKSQHNLDSVENTDKSTASHQCKIKTNDQIDARLALARV